MKAIYNGIKFVDIDNKIDLPTDFETDRIPNKGDVLCFRSLEGNKSEYHHCEVLYVLDNREGWEGSLEEMEIKTVSIFVVTKKIEPELGEKTWKSINEIVNKKTQKTDKKSFEWNDNQVFDFVNWYIELNKLDFRYTLENREIIESFKRGDKPSDWDQK